MNKKKNIHQYLINPLKVIQPLGSRGFFKWLPDKIYLKLIYRAKFSKKLNLNNPATFNDKLQWLKLYNRKKEYIKYVDKLAVRSFVSETIGEKYLTNLIKVYNNVDDIKWDELPNKFVIKCTHGSGTNIVCNDKTELNINTAEYRLKNWIKKNWYWFGREWPYKFIKPRIICEEFLSAGDGSPPPDYKFFCFSGEPKLVQVDFERFANHTQNYYDMEWNFIDVQGIYPNNKDVKLQKPERFEEMKNIARRLSKGILHVRVDLYLVNDKVYFGELTLYHLSGLGDFKSKELDRKLGQWLNIPNEYV